MNPDEPGSPLSLIDPLTVRERDILRLMAEDLPLQAMAERLVLSPATVKWYTQQIYGKLGILEAGPKRRLAVARARTLGLLGPDRTPGGRPRYALPVQTTPLVGRARELHEIAGLLATPGVRLVTLLGAGGIGKTRLALALAWRLVEPDAYGMTWAAFPDGVYFVPLQPLDTAEHIVWAMAEAVGYPFHGDTREPVRQMLDFFREKRLLLVLDNFEHVLEGAALVSQILQAAPGVQALATSREALNLAAETVYPVQGLPFPGGAGHTPDHDAARLFVQGARRARASFALQPDDWPSLARICQMVDGMPLALLLAAAWVNTLSVPEIAEEIARGFDFLAAEMRDVPPRQRSIRAVFEPTWQRLGAAERDAFMRLSVFRGGCTRQAAQTVSGASLPVLQGLVNKAVLSYTAQGRYQIHELLRQYAGERLAAAGGAEAARDAHCAYHAAFMRDREADLKGGDRQLAALEEIDAEFENIRAAWDWAIERRRVAALAQMERVLWYFLHIRGRRAEGLALFQSALSIDDDRALLGRLMGRCSRFCLDSGRNREAEDWARRSLDIAREMEDLLGLAFALRTMATAAVLNDRDFERAYQLADESVALCQKIGDEWEVIGTLICKGGIAAEEGDHLSALAFAEEAARLARVQGDQHRLAQALNNVAVAHAELGEPLQALQLFNEGLSILRVLSAPAMMSTMLGNMAMIARHLGNYDAALQYFEEEYVLANEFCEPSLIAANLRSLADTLSLTGRLDEAAERLTECARVVKSVEEMGLAQWVPYTRAMIAYRTGDCETASRWAQAALDFPQGHRLSQLESFCWLLAGLIEIRRGEREAAREHIRASLPGLRSKEGVLRGIYGVAALEAVGGQPERAVELAALVQEHRAAEYEFKGYATELLAELEATLPPEVYAAAAARGAALDPDAVVAGLLAQ